MSYKNALPYFPEEDIKSILSEVEKMLSGQGFLTKGPRVKEFETAFASYTGCKYAITTNSGTSALEIVLKSIGITGNDEVIVPTQTFIATGSSIITAGGKVVFCDSDQDFSLDFEDLKKKINANTKAVILVHFAGLIHPQMMLIRDFLKNRNIFLIEDCAHASGASIDGVMVGNIGDFGCHSFYSTKIMTTGEGGMITTNNEEFYYTCSSIRSIGIDAKSGREIFDQIGSNNRMAEFESILGLHQLKRLEEFVDHRIKIANVYKEELKDLEAQGTLRFQHVAPGTRHPYWKFIVFFTSNTIARDRIKEIMLKSGINIEAPYQPLMHLQPVFKRLYNLQEGSLPQAEGLVNTHFCLPIHLQISAADAKDISKILKQALLV